MDEQNFPFVLFSKANRQWPYSKQPYRQSIRYVQDIMTPNFAVLSPPLMSGIERGERELLKWSEILWRKEHLIGGITAQLEKMPKGKRQKASLSHFFPHTKRQD